MEHYINHHPLLATKTTIPPTYLKRIIPRPRLHDQLNAGLQRPLTLVVAPAGFGKTTLLGEWLRKSTAPVAWVSLDQHDNDTERFWCYILTSLNSFAPDISAQLLARQQSIQPYNLDRLLTDLINNLVLLPHDLILVLDDYHTITSPDIHRSLLYLLEHLPPHIHLLVSSRLDPPIPLARLRVQGKVVEVRANNLRFTYDEIGVFMIQGMGINLSTEDIRELGLRSEGWIAGLQLAALSLLEREDPVAVTSFIKTFSGINRNIVSYLTDEVLAHLSVEQQDFLLTTSILERLNVSLCNAVTEQQNGQAMLEWLDQSNLFLIPLDEQASWYRYYHLFAASLQYRLKQTHAALIPQLHLRASIWYEQHDQIFDAVVHALAAREVLQAATLIEKHAWTFIQQGAYALVSSWLKQLPPSAFLDHPLLSYLHAWTLLCQGDIKDYEQALQQAEQLWDAQHNRHMLSHVFEMKASVALLSQNGTQILDYAQKMLSHAPPDDLYLLSSAHVYRGIGSFYNGDTTTALSALNEGYHLSQKCQHVPASLMATLYLSDIHAIQGDLQAVVQMFRQPLPEISQNKHWYNISAHVRLAQIEYEWNNTASAQEHCKHALSMAEQAEQTGLATAERYLLAARLSILHGEQPRAFYWLAQAEQRSQHFGPNSFALAHITDLRVRFSLAQNDLTAALRWYEQYLPAQTTSIQSLEKEIWEQIQARLAIAQGQPDAAIPPLEKLVQATQADGRIGNTIAILALLALAYHADGNTQQTLQTLERALTLAEPHNYLRTFVDEGTLMTVLLSELYSRHQRRPSNEPRTISLNYIYSLLSASGQDLTPPTWIVPQNSAIIMLDKLSEREQTVLSLIAAGLSNQEIAQKLVVTVSTIKTHLNNIYAKLHVHTRLQAVTKAYDVGLLRRSELDTEPLKPPYYTHEHA